jgi:hypothetical protein
MTFHTARATCFPQPKAGVGPGPGPLTVPANVLPTMLGIRTITYKPHPTTMTVSDKSLA